MFKKRGLAIFIFGAVLLLNLSVYSYLQYRLSIPVTLTLEQKTKISPDSEDDVFATVEHSKDWHEGLQKFGIQYDVVIHNNTSHDLTDWQLRLVLPDEARLSDSWNIEYEISGDVLYAVCMEHNRIIEAEDVQTFGFILIAPAIEEIEDVGLRFTPIYHMTDFPVFWANAILSAILALLLIAWAVVETRLAPMQRESEEDKSIIVQTMQTFSNFIDTKDPNTKGHSMRVAYYSRELARKLKLPERDVELIYYIALLHDIGKIYIPDEILNKPGRLTPDERAIIETHAEKGAEILKDFTAIEGIADGARYHHEHYDGGGYPLGLKGENIPFLARIICVADSYDAMSSDRCYRPRLSRETIINEIKNNSGTQFDPEVAECMLELLESDGFYTDMLEETGTAY